MNFDKINSITWSSNAVIVSVDKIKIVERSRIMKIYLIPAIHEAGNMRCQEYG